MFEARALASICDPAVPSRLVKSRLSPHSVCQGYAEVVQELLPNATTAPALNRTLGANWFNWRNSSGQMHQVWRVPQPSC